MPDCTLIEAVNDALATAMDGDESVLVMGEDVGRNGGMFRATQGLQERFGEERVIDMPLAEAGMAGSAIGLAIYGFRPVLEIQFLGFSFQAFAQLLAQAARVRGRSSGRFTCPLVMRAPCGFGIHAHELHSDVLESHFVHTSGLKVVAPARPYDAKGLLLAAIHDPDPVIFLEPLRLYRAGREFVPGGHYEVPIGKAAIVRQGSDITIIAWSAMVPVALAAAEMLAAEHIDCEVIDLRTLSPLDTETIIPSIQKTGRAIVVHEAARTLGPGAEISAVIQEQAFLYLEAPVLRVTGYDVLVPAILEAEAAFFPTTQRIIDAVKCSLQF